MLLQDADIISVWSDQLFQIPAAALTHANLPADTLTFLENVGLPPLLGYGAHEPWIIFRKAPPYPVIRMNVADYLIIGDDEFGGTLGLKIPTGKVCWLGETATDSSRLINSSIRLTMVFRTLLKRVHDDSQTNNHRALYEWLKAEFTAQDPAALEDENALWSVILEEMEYALDE